MARPCITQPQKCPSCLRATKASREPFAFKMCSQRHIKHRAQPSDVPSTARPSKCTISSVTPAWSGMTTLKPQQRSIHTCLNTHRRIMGSLCTQKVLATAAPARQREQLSGACHGPLAHPNALFRALHEPGVARPRRTQPQKRHACVLSTRRDASRDPFALKRCVLETCGTSKLLAERPTSRPSKSIILSVTHGS